MTLEQLLKMKVGEGKDKKPVVEFSVKVVKAYERAVDFVIHPAGIDGETLELRVSDNILTDLRKRQKEKESVTITKDDIGTLDLGK